MADQEAYGLSNRFVSTQLERHDRALSETKGTVETEGQ
jgi:hypothetical protein